MLHSHHHLRHNKQLVKMDRIKTFHSKIHLQLPIICSEAHLPLRLDLKEAVEAMTADLNVEEKEDTVEAAVVVVVEKALLVTEVVGVHQEAEVPGCFKAEVAAEARVEAVDVVPL
jgi:hypothetical protein